MSGSSELREMQGLYGPYTLSERVLQKVWLRQDFFREGLTTGSGKSLQIKHPGCWNLLAGPDFREARLVLDGQVLVGDVEVHFNVADWHAHRHASNSDFDGVVLHVVLHPDAKRTPPARTGKGNIPEVLYLLPLLNYDLESYAADEALLALEKVDELEWVAQFLERPEWWRRQRIMEHAHTRWQQKLEFAKKRLAGAGWSEACHQFCLEVLGYSRNRTPMARIALSYPLAQMIKGDVSVNALFESERCHWRLSGIRPMNQPKHRLAQYLGLLAACPNWPLRLADLLQGWPQGDGSHATRIFRKTYELPDKCAALRDSVFGAQIGERRLNTLLVDAILPLATAAGLLDAQPYWMHWPMGDCPDALRRFLKHAQMISHRHPSANGLIQGALALSLEQGR